MNTPVNVPRAVSKRTGAMQPGERWSVRVDADLITAALPSNVERESQNPRALTSKVLYHSLPRFCQVAPSPALLSLKHPFRELLLSPLKIPKPQQYRDFLRLAGPVIQGIGCAIPASFEPTHPLPQKDYSNHEWARDKRYALLLLKWLSQDEAIWKVAASTMSFYARPEIQRTFSYYHFQDNLPSLAYSNRWAPQPLVRVPIDRDGQSTQEITHGNGHHEDGKDWRHDQPGSFGEFVWELLRMGNQGLLDLQKLNSEVASNVDHLWGGKERNALRGEALIVTITKFLHGISCCTPEWSKRKRFHLYSTGAWEEEPALNRLSEITPIYAAALELDKFFRRFGYNELPISGDKEKFKDTLGELLQLSGEAFEKRLPRFSSNMARERDGERQFDSAVAFTLWPYDLDLTEHQEESILKTLYHLMKRDNYRGAGVIRYEGDRYCAGPFPAHTDVNWNVDSHTPGFREQQWFLTDPIIALRCARRATEMFEAGTNPDRALLYYYQAVSHAKRVVSQLPFEDSNYKITSSAFSEPFTVKVTGGQYREGATFDDKGKLIFGPNSLHWTASLATIMHIRMLKASEHATQYMRQKSSL